MTRPKPLDVERKIIGILKVISDSPEPVGSRVIANRLTNSGIYLSERAVRYHMKLMDKRGLTHLKGKRYGRLITQQGLNELDDALVGDRIGSAKTRIEKLAYQASFEPERCTGEVPVNVSLLPEDGLRKSIELMSADVNDRFCFADLVAVAGEGKNLGGVRVPRGKVGFATLSSSIIGAVLLKAGIPLDYKFAGILQIRDRNCVRFVELIEYTGCSLEPYEVFLTNKMTSVSEASNESGGKVLASFCELPDLARAKTEATVEMLKAMRINIVAKIGRTGQPICETQVGAGKIGIIVIDGLNLVASVIEQGIEVINYAACGLINFGELKRLQEW